MVARRMTGVGIFGARISRRASKKARLRVFVNQVGYERAGPKSAVEPSNFFPPDGSTLPLEIVTAGGRTVWTQEVPCASRIYGGTEDDWGWYFWRADFSSCQQEGPVARLRQSSGLRTGWSEKRRGGVELLPARRFHSAARDRDRRGPDRLDAGSALRQPHLWWHGG